MIVAHISEEMMAKIALVTGGTRGIGARIAMDMRAHGYEVVSVYGRDHEQAQKFSGETGIHIFSWDVSSYQACVDGVARVEDRLGSSVDVLVNNAGITRDTMLHKMSVYDWESVISTNLSSIFYMTSSVIGQMRAKMFGRIINISSINGVKGQVGQCNYAAAKAGVIGFSKSLALESASKNITVNVVAPGYIATDMTAKISEDILGKIAQSIPVGHLGDVQDVASAVLFLASDAASFITGATIHVNGGQHMA